METSWPYDEGTFKIGERPNEQLPDQAATLWDPPPEAPATLVTVPVPRSETTTRAGAFPSEHAVAEQPRSVRYWAERANAKSCWMCGIRLSADRMVADGGRACLDVRWYCRDTWACTERWTSRPATPTAIAQGTAETPKTPAEQTWGTDAAWPVTV